MSAAATTAALKHSQNRRGDCGCGDWTSNGSTVSHEVHASTAVERAVRKSIAKSIQRDLDQVRQDTDYGQGVHAGLAGALALVKQE